VLDNPDKIKKHAKYGDRPGEKRINVSDMVKPLGSFERGTDYVPKTGDYKLHEGEKVTPAKDNMADLYDKVPGRKSEGKPKKEIKHIITSKTHDGKYLHKHVHHHPSHEDETHVSNNMAELHNHFEDHAGTPNMGEEAVTGASAPAPMTAGPSPVPGTAPTAVPGA
jgi:hypothetical protein